MFNVFPRNLAFTFNDGKHSIHPTSVCDKNVAVDLIPLTPCHFDCFFLPSIFCVFKSFLSLKGGKTSTKNSYDVRLRSSIACKEAIIEFSRLVPQSFSRMQWQTDVLRLQTESGTHRDVWFQSGNTTSSLYFFVYFVSLHLSFHCIHLAELCSYILFSPFNDPSSPFS